MVSTGAATPCGKPGVSARWADHQRLLRAADALEKDFERVVKELAASFRRLLDEGQTVAFHDLTAVRILGENSFGGDIRAFGESEDVGGVARQARSAWCRRRTD